MYLSIHTQDKECLEAKGLKINISKTKVRVSGKNCVDVEKSGK